MPSYGPEVLGPPQRDPEQQFWDPEIQTMDPEKLQALQERASSGPGPARSSTLRSRCSPASSPRLASTSGQDLKTLDDIRRTSP